MAKSNPDGVINLYDSAKEVERNFKLAKTDERRQRRTYLGVLSECLLFASCNAVSTDEEFC